MDITRVWARNWRSHQAFDIALPLGATAIIGPNGAGKSSILHALDAALFGGDLAANLTRGAGETELEVGCEFDHAARRYRIVRTYSARGRGKTSLRFEQYGDPPVPADDGCWEPLTRETTRDTQALIEQVLGVSRATLAASAYLRQGDSGAFTDAQPRDRKAILADALDLGRWDRLLVQCRFDLSFARNRCAAARAELDALEAELAQRSGVDDEITRLRAAEGEATAALDAASVAEEKARAELAAAREAAAAADAARRAHATAVRARDDAYVRRDRLADQISDLATAVAQRDNLALLADGVAEHEAELERARTHEQAVRAASGEVERLRRDLEAAQARTSRAAQTQTARRDARRRAEDALDAVTQGEAPTCPECGQSVHDEARARLAASLEARAVAAAEALREAEEAYRHAGAEAALIQRSIADAGRALSDLTASSPRLGVREAQALLEQARAAAVALARLAEREAILSQLNAQARDLDATLPALDQAVADAQAAIPDEDGYAPLRCEATLIAAKEQHSRRRDDVVLIQRDLARNEGRLERLNTAATLASEQRKIVADAQRDIDVLALLERAYGPSGIPALILENAAIPAIEATANQVLRDLGTDYAVELRTQRALKSGAGLADTLDIVVTTPTGDSPLEQFSGGERSRLNIALRLGLARLLSTRRGADVRLLAIDEVEYLDDAGTERLAEVLRGLQGDFERILLISHQPSLRDAFDHAIMVSKGEDGGSVVDGGRRAPDEVGAAA